MPVHSERFFIRRDQNFTRLTRRGIPHKIDLRNRHGFESPDMNQGSVIIYSRPGCHLCEGAKALLHAYGLAPEEIDITSDPKLVQQYGESIPVIVIDGKERFRGRIDEILLRRLLQSREDDAAE